MGLSTACLASTAWRFDGVGRQPGQDYAVQVVETGFGPAGPGSEVGNQQVVARAKKNFLRPRSFRFQVYKQYRYTSIVIVLTQALFCG